jgi:hypothetical protein
VRRSARACGEAYAGELQICYERENAVKSRGKSRACIADDRQRFPFGEAREVPSPTGVAFLFSTFVPRSPHGQRRRRASLSSLFLPRLATRSRCSCRFSRLGGDDGFSCDNGSPSSAANFQQLPAKRERSDATAAGAPWLTESTEATKNTDLESARGTLLICRKAFYDLARSGFYPSCQ